MSNIKKFEKIKKIKKHYVPRISAERPNYDILDWAGPDSQRLRFEVLTRHLDLAGKSLLDVGCGLGDLAAFLDKLGIDVDYTGVDVVPEMLARAGQANPGRRFECLDIFAETTGQVLATLGVSEPFDIVFCSGALNLNLGNNLRFLPRAMESMLRLTRQWMVVNFLHTRLLQRDEIYFNYNPAEVIEILQPLCRDIQLVDDYLDNDFSLICRVKS